MGEIVRYWKSDSDQFSRRFPLASTLLLASIACFTTSSLRYGTSTTSASGYVAPPTGFLYPSQSLPESENGQPLRMTAEIIRQYDCRNGNKTYLATLKLRMSFLNETNKNIIVEKTPGLGVYGITVARDARSLSEGNYEFNPDIFQEVDHFPPETPEQFMSPGANFTILAPGESLQCERELRALTVEEQPTPRETPGTLRPGNHVLRISVSTWDFSTKPHEVRKRWEPFGYLVYESLSAGPLPFSLPPDPRLDKCN